MRHAWPISAARSGGNPELPLIAAFCLLWSAAFAVAKLALADCPPLLMLTVRFLAASAIMLASAAIRGANWRLGWRDCLAMAAFGIATNVLYLTFSYSAMATISSGLMALIASVNPVLTAVLAACFLDETLTVRKIIGLVLGVAGVALVVESRIAGGVTGVYGIGFAVAALTSLTGATILFKRFAPKTDLVVANGVQTLAAGLAVAPFAFAFESVGDLVPTWRFLAAMAYLVLCSSIVAYLLWFHMLNVFGATTASSFHFLMPPLGMLFGWILLGEQVYAPDLIGVAPVAAGIWLVTRPSPSGVKAAYKHTRHPPGSPPVPPPRDDAATGGIPGRPRWRRR
jgi:drug/metabolite transporter (DMT)-like permease